MDFLVATDAIGMGLNMDVDHVAFARLGKFDGHRPRRLAAAEVAQIAGRAGRGMRDGTFGTTAGCAPIDEELADAVENHRFEPLEQLAWRNSELDFSHVDRLLDTLLAPPPRSGLVRGRDASDLETLLALAREAEVRDLAGGRRMVRTLWDCCQIPDFRKLADDSHARFCARVFGHLARDGHLPADWLDGQVAALDRVEGDIDTLMQRLSGVRVWSYIAARPDWVRDATGMQDRARAVEDKLSDALHEKLTARFVDRRSTLLIRRLENAEGESLLSASRRRARSWSRGTRWATWRVLASYPTQRPQAMRSASCSAPPAAPCVRRCHGGSTHWRPQPIARLPWVLMAASPGAAPPSRGCGPAAPCLRPAVEVADSEYLDGPGRERVRIRVLAFVRRTIEAELASVLRLDQETDPALRGPLHQVSEAGGVAAAVKLPQKLRAQLKALGVRAGRFGLYVPRRAETPRHHQCGRRCGP